MCHVYCMSGEVSFLANSAPFIMSFMTVHLCVLTVAAALQLTDTDTIYKNIFLLHVVMSYCLLGYTAQGSKF